MADDNHKVKIDLDVSTTGEDSIYSLIRAIDAVNRKTNAINANMKTIGRVQTPGRSSAARDETAVEGVRARGRRAKKASEDQSVRSAQAINAFDRASVALFKTKLASQTKATTEALRAERQTFANFKTRNAAQSRYETDQVRALKDRLTAERRITTMRVASERATASAQARTASEAARATTRRMQDAANAIRATARLDIVVQLSSGRGDQDSCDIILDDRDWLIATPRKGDRLSVYLGYEGIGTTFMGNFEVNSINFSFVPKAITVRCTAASSLNDLKSTVIADYKDKTVEQILAEAGQKIGFKADVHKSIADEKIPFLNQTMSFGQLIGKLEQHYDAVAKINDGKVSLTPRAGGVSVSDISVPTYVLRPYNFADLNVMVDAASEYAKTSASYTDPKTNKREWLDVKSQLKDLSTDAEHKIGTLFPSKDEAQKAAESTQAQLDRATGKITGRLAEGDAWVRDMQRIVVTDCRDGINGSYLLDLVVHSYTKGGALTTSFSGTAGVNGLAEEYQEGNNASEYISLPAGMVFGQVLVAPESLGNSFNSVPSLVGANPAPIPE